MKKRKKNNKKIISEGMTPPCPLYWIRGKERKREKTMVRYYFDAYISGQKEIKKFVVDTFAGGYEARHMAEKKLTEEYKNKTFILVLTNKKMLIPA